MDVKRISSLILAATLLAGAADAQEHHTGSVKVEGAWARPAASGNGAAYLTLENAGGVADRLTSAAAPVAGAVEFHTHAIDAQGVARMRPVTGVDLPAGGSAAFAPGAMHVMLVGLTGPLQDGQTFPLTLNFAHAGAVTVQVAVGSGAGHGAGSHAGH